MNKYETDLQINANKVRPEHPHLIGPIGIDGEKYRIALYLQPTKDGTKDYYSGSLQLAEDHESPRSKITLYQCRKGSDSDPDYGSTEERRAEINGRFFYAYLWIKVTPKDSVDELEFHFELSEQPRRQALSDKAQNFKTRVLSQLKQPAALAARPIFRDENGDPDDISF